MEAEEIIQALTATPELVGKILPALAETEALKTLVTNRANAEKELLIADKIKEVHSKYDDDLFEVLGVRAGTGANGAKEKTYELVKSKLAELKTLQGQKESLTKDAQVALLTSQIEELKKTGGAKEVKDMFDTAKAQWQEKETTYLDQIKNATQGKENFQKSVSIKSAFQELKFNPDIPEAVRKALIDNAEAELVKNSKLNEDGTLVFLDKEGKVILNPATYQPKTASEVVESMEVIKGISLKDDSKKGGGAKSEITGSIKTTTVEGKDTKSLVLPEGIKTKVQFIEEAEKALFASGITMRDPEFNELKNKAYKELEVDKMPAQ
jgi:thioredoxin-related protein